MDKMFPNRSWAEVDLDVLTSNMKEVRRITAPQAEIMAIVKADGYGHGAVECAKVFLANGAERLGVSLLDEAIELRENGIEAPILILGYTDPRRILELINYNLTPTVYTLEYAELLSSTAKAMDKTLTIHLKIDTGMGRIGFMPDHSSLAEIQQINGFSHLFVEGIYSHFARADEADAQYAWRQFASFQKLLQTLHQNNIHIPIAHICNSAGILRFPSMHLNLVRAGLILYGMKPAGDFDFYQEIQLLPALTIKSNIIHLKNVPKGYEISYGGKFTTKRSSFIATIPIGYADGYLRGLSNRAYVLIKGQRAPVIGNICMDMCMVDVTDLKPIPELLEEVVVFGKATFENRVYQLPVDELSTLLDTINYEITCLVGKRVPRVYLHHGEISSMHSFIAKNVD